ncbi:MAG: hypothetical protein ABUK13_02715 [Gammaproteobacteria bacterium]
MGKIYDNPDRKVYNLGVIDFGDAANRDITIPGRTGMKGTVVGIQAFVTEAFLVDTLDANVQVGSAAGEVEYGNLVLTDALALDDIINEDTLPNTIPDFVSGIASGNTQIPSGGDVYVRGKFGTDGTAVTGQAEVQVTIDWYC